MCNLGLGGAAWARADPLQALRFSRSVRELSVLRHTRGTTSSMLTAT